MMLRRMVMLLGVAVAALGGCATTQTKSQHFADPIAVMTDTTALHERQWAAAHQAEREMRNSPRRIDALHRIVWQRGYPADYRNYAVDQLVELDEAKAKHFLGNAMLLCREWDTIQHILDTAVRRKWVDFVPAIVQQYALTTPVYTDAQRPERAAIEKLRPGVPVDQVVMDVFAHATGASMSQRAAAWDLLHRLTHDNEQLITALNAIHSDDPLVLDLQAGARDLHIVPINAETIAWLQVIRLPDHAGFWSAAKSAVAQLTPEQQHGLALRHMPMLVWFAHNDPSMLHATADDLRQRIAAFTHDQHHDLKGPTFDGPMDSHPQLFAESQAKLCWADLLTLVGVSKWMTDPAIVAAWFKQADADHADTSTEYGGLMRLTTDYTVEPQLYEPMFRKHDMTFIPPQQMVLDGYTALAHFHFHAQHDDNRLYAGPSVGDMDRVAHRQRFSAIVLTFIHHDTLNVDYYQPEDIVVDMGEVHRPRK